MQKYGLQIRTKLPSSSSSRAPPPPARPLAVFADDYVEAESLRQVTKKRFLQKVTCSSHASPPISCEHIRYSFFSAFPHCPDGFVARAQVEEQQKKAMEEDPSVYAYDELYDEMNENIRIQAERNMMWQKYLENKQQFAQQKEACKSQKIRYVQVG